MAGAEAVVTLETQRGADGAATASFDPLDWGLAERVAAPRRRERPALVLLPRRIAARRFLVGHGDRRATRCRTHRAVRTRAGAGAGRRPRVVGVGQRGVDAAPPRAAHGPGRGTDGRQCGGTHRSSNRRHRDRGVVGLPRAACPRSVRLARRRRRRLGGCRLLRGRQHPGAREAVRVPAARLPAVDRDPRVHAPGAVHGRVVDEAVLPLVGRRDAGVDRS